MLHVDKYRPLTLTFTILFHDHDYGVLGRDRFIISNSGGALPPVRFGTSLSRRALLLFHHPYMKERSGLQLNGDHGFLACGCDRCFETFL